MLIPALRSVLVGIFNYLDQETEGVFVTRFWVDEKHNGSTRAPAWGLVDKVEPRPLHIIVRCFGVAYTEGQVGQAAPSAILVDELLHRRSLVKRFDDLNHVRAIANLQQCLAYLVAAEHFFAVNLAESEQLICLNLLVQFARTNRNGNVIKKRNPGTFSSSWLKALTG